MQNINREKIFTLNRIPTNKEKHNFKFCVKIEYLFDFSKNTKNWGKDNIEHYWQGIVFRCNEIGKLPISYWFESDFFFENQAEAIQFRLLFG